MTTPAHPVTLGDLFVKIVRPSVGPVYSRATVADLVSARRAEGVLVVVPFGECQRCEGAGIEAFIGVSTIQTGESAFYPCTVCYGSGYLWDGEIVEVVGTAIQSAWGLDMSSNHLDRIARAVLLALAEAQP